jgi:hypothetical protein
MKIDTSYYNKKWFSVCLSISFASFENQYVPVFEDMHSEHYLQQTSTFFYM